MGISRLVGLTAKLIETQKPRARTIRAPSILRLEDLLHIRSPLENLGSLRGELLEYYPRILFATNTPHPGENHEVIIFGVDSSARIVELATSTIIVSSVSVSSNVRGFSWDWPSIFTRGGPVLDEPVIRVLPNDEDEDEIDDPLISYRNPAGYRYDPDYSMYQALDEARVSAENKALEAILEIVESGKIPRRPVVLIDGPVYLVPGVLAVGGGRVEYVKAWEKLLNERLKIIRKLVENNVLVYGIVKRIEKARVLEKTSLPASYERCTGPIRGRSDRSIIHSGMTNRCYGSIIKGKALATPPVRILAPQGAEKVVQYIVIPQPWTMPSPHASIYYRVEEPVSQWMTNRGRIGRYRSPAIGALLDSVARGSLEPITIRWSDRRARDTSMYLRELLVRGAWSAGLPVSYSETVEEAVMQWQKVAT